MIMIIFITGQIKTLAVFDVETKSHYWLTVYAEDHGVIPLSSRLEVSLLSLLLTRILKKKNFLLSIVTFM